MTDEQADAILDIRASCLGLKKTIMYIVVNNENPNKDIQVVSPKAVLDKERVDVVLKVLLDISDFDKYLTKKDCHVVWDMLIKNWENHKFLKFDLDDNKHIELTTIKLSELKGNTQGKN